MGIIINKKKKKLNHNNKLKIYLYSNIFIRFKKSKK